MVVAILSLVVSTIVLIQYWLIGIVVLFGFSICWAMALIERLEKRVDKLEKLNATRDS